MFRGEKQIAKLAPMWSLDEMANHAVDFWLSTEDLPRPENRVTLESDGSIRLSYTKTNEVPDQEALRSSSSRCWASSGCTRTTCCPATSI